MSESLTKRDAARRTVLNVARGMLDGSILLVEGCRKLVGLRTDAQIPANDAFNVFRGVESETDDYPVGNVRSEYAPELLARLDAEVSTYMSQVRPAVIEACRQIIRVIVALEL
jgi:hypothetical protein